MFLRTGDKKVYQKTVEASDQAIFHDTLLHPVYSTFAHLRATSSGLPGCFSLEMKEDDEEGVGNIPSY